jgi:hypothetical protein
MALAYDSNSSDSEDIPEPYSGVGHHFKVLYTHPVSELLAERTARKVLAKVQNDTELPVPPVIAVEKIDCASLSSNLSKKKTMTRWPQMTSLMKDAFYSHQILRMLQVVTKQSVLKFLQQRRVGPRRCAPCAP